MSRVSEPPARSRATVTACSGAADIVAAMPYRHRILRPTAALGALAATALVLAGCTSTTLPVEAPPTSTAPAAPPQQSPSTDAAATGNDAAFAAITTAEDETQGIAYELELDDGLWEVHVAVGDTDAEVRTSGDGAEVVSTDTDDTVDDDDRRALDAAGITLAVALQAAIDGHGSGSVDEISVSDDVEGQLAWEVSFTDDVEVYVAVVDGAILRVDR